MITPLTPTISAIKLPDGAVKPEIYLNGTLTFGIPYKNSIQTVNIPKGFTRILGPVSELTPEQKAEIVEVEWKDFPTKQDYVDFVKKIEGLFSILLESKRVHTVNPYGDKPEKPRCPMNTEENKAQHANHGYMLNKWNESEQYVGNWILIKKEV